MASVAFFTSNHSVFNSNHSDPLTTVASAASEASFAAPGRGGPEGASRPGESVTASNHSKAGGLGGVVFTPQN